MNEQNIRTIAAVAAVAIFAYPFVQPLFGSLWASILRPRVSDPVKQKMADIQIVLGLSSRLSAGGSKEGVDLCQKLIDVLLKPQK